MKLKNALLVGLASAVVTGQTETWQPNPFGEGCLNFQYVHLSRLFCLGFFLPSSVRSNHQLLFFYSRYAELLKLGVNTNDVTIPREKSFDPNSMPSFLDYGRNQIVGDWNKFISSYCIADPGDGNTNVPAWMGECRTVANRVACTLSVSVPSPL